MLRIATTRSDAPATVETPSIGGSAIAAADHRHSREDPPASSAAAPRGAATNAVAIWSALSKARLSALVVMTTAVGYWLAPDAGPSSWRAFIGTVLGTALAAASAAMLNQLAEIRADSRMERTRHRPLPAGLVRPAIVLVVGLLCAYAGVSLVALSGSVLAAALAFGTIVVYVLLYTPLKPLTTLNTIVGAVTGATPPLIGWAAASGELAPGAWVLGGLLFVWQIPHFFALAWMYREDYRRGGFVMLPVVDGDGRITSETVLLTSLLLVPLSLLVVIFGVCGWWFAAGALLLGLWLSARAFRFWRLRTHASARGVFTGTIIYLPLLLILAAADRGAVSPLAAVRGGQAVHADAPDATMDARTPRNSNEFSAP